MRLNEYLWSKELTCPHNLALVNFESIFQMTNIANMIEFIFIGLEYMAGNTTYFSSFHMFLKKSSSPE